ncbi:uncharacterized protein LOC114329037 isoform X3 [Diabrotica virgifera virgifera]|uniref:Uncharacterized protein LOC114329037 isoform X2 n=1 Tax=Diabrotica virgifera virgifera TaxID=50390 RepID=A0A6P7FCX8_DIAVI|nr:uncharacterized protein LOC114329037 isoform X3 [Diabrotica virgifera virgifera]
MKIALVLALLSCVALTIYAQQEPISNERRCDTCIALASIIKDYAAEHVPLDKVRRDVERLCDDLADDLREACERELLPNLDKVYEELKKRTPLEFCEKHEQCGRK